jgi:hypothetical protein
LTNPVPRFEKTYDSLRTLVFLVFDRMSLREHALVKDTGDKNASAFLAVKYDVLAVFKTM